RDSAWLEPALQCIEQWSSRRASLVEPVEVRLPWSRAAGRDRALQLAEEVLASALERAGAYAPLAGLGKTLKKARAMANPESRSFETLQKKLLPSCEKARAERAETEMAARAAVEDVELNRRAYLSLIVKLSFEIVMGALGVQPNFRAIFERRE